MEADPRLQYRTVALIFLYESSYGNVFLCALGKYGFCVLTWTLLEGETNTHYWFPSIEIVTANYWFLQLSLQTTQSVFITAIWVQFEWWETCLHHLVDQLSLAVVLLQCTKRSKGCSWPIIPSTFAAFELPVTYDLKPECTQYYTLIQMFSVRA